ncbi:MAG: hypothetical protein IH623_14900 [Verrucomicrobia bacterium]|nr:hypothetical protein [Verrucomicrobiota bacterium]
MRRARAKFTCPCCGYRTFRRRPGNYEICHVCFWEDDPVQLLDPWYPGGANNVSLQEAQQNYAQIGVSEPKFKPNVKGVLSGDARDPLWRPVKDADRQRATTPAKLTKENPKGPWKWYYWEQ